MARLRRNADWLMALGLFTFALATRVLMLVAAPFDGLYGQDAYDYYQYAAQVRDHLAQGLVLPPFFWPLGYPMHVVAASWLMGMQPLAGQLVSLIAGALIARLTFALAREALLPIDPARARRAGLVAGLSVAAAGQLMISSLSIMSDATGLAWATASAWLTLRYARTLRPGTLLLASLALSIAVITRWVFGLLALPWVACVLLAWWRNWSSIGLRRALALGASAVVVGGALIGVHLSAGGAHTGDLQVVGWDPTNAFRSEVNNSDGTFRYNLPIGLFYLQPLVVPSYVFPLLVPLWLVGLWSLGRMNASTRALLIGWPSIGYLFLAGIAWQNPRFALAFFPPLVVWVGLGFDHVWESRPGWRRGLGVLVALAVAGSFAWSLRVVNDFVTRKNLDLARAQHLTDQLPDGAQVITFGLTLTLQHYTDLDAIEIYNETPDSLAQRVCGSDTTYVYLDVANIEQQWRGLAPEINYRWLRDGAGLAPIDRVEGYSLFVVGKCG